jgi:hypothetical protein
MPHQSLPQPLDGQLFVDSFESLKKSGFDRFPRHCFNSTCVQLGQSALNFHAPRFLNVRIDFGFQAFDQQAREGGSFPLR